MTFEADSTRGTLNHYGNRETNQKYGGVDGSRGVIKTAVWEISYDDLPTYGTDPMITTIPGDALILSSRLHVQTAFADGTSYNIGWYQSDSTVIDVDGVDAAVATAALTEDAWIICDGAISTNDLLGADAGQLVVAATGVFTAGKAKLYVEYIDSTAP